MFQLGRGPLVCRERWLSGTSCTVRTTDWLPGIGAEMDRVWQSSQTAAVITWCVKGCRMIRRDLATVVAASWGGVGEEMQLVLPPSIQPAVNIRARIQNDAAWLLALR